MRDTIRVVLFSEVNSKLGGPFLRLLAEHPSTELVGVVTSPVGRTCPYFVDDEIQVDLEQEGLRRGIPVHRPDSAKDPALIDRLREVAPDYFVVGNFQQILRPELLAVPSVTSINFHPSPLPRYAGRAPFFWMARDGARYAAVSALEIDEGIDTGPILMQRDFPVTGLETGIELRTVQENANVAMLEELIPMLLDESFTRTPQDLTRRSYRGQPTDTDYLIDFTAGADDVMRSVRAGYRHPGAYAVGADGARTVVLSAESVGGAYLPPLEGPGAVRRTDRGLLVATADDWVRLVTVDAGGDEVPVESVLTGELADFVVPAVVAAGS